MPRSLVERPSPPTPLPRGERGEQAPLSPRGRGVGGEGGTTQRSLSFVEAAAMFLPQKYHAQVGGAEVATFQQNMNPFVKKLTLDFSMDPPGRLDRRLGLAAGILLSAIEVRQT